MKVSRIKIILWLWLFFWITTIFTALTLALSLGLTHFRYDYNDFIIYVVDPCKNFNIITSSHFQNMKIYDILFISLNSLADLLQIFLAIMLSLMMFCKQQTYIQQNSKRIRKNSQINNFPNANVQDSQNNHQFANSRSAKLTQIILPKYLIQITVFASFVFLMTALGHDIRIFIQIFKSQNCIDSKMNSYRDNMYPQIISQILACISCGIQIVILAFHHLNQRANYSQELAVSRQQIANSEDMLQIKLKYREDNNIEVLDQASRQKLFEHQDIPSQQKLKNPKNLTIEIDEFNQAQQQKKHEQPIKHQLITLRDIEVASPKIHPQNNSNQSNSSSKIEKDRSHHSKRSYKIFELGMNEDEYKSYRTIQDQNSNSSPQQNKLKKRKKLEPYSQFNQNYWS